jgi:hypothetical protein
VWTLVIFRTRNPVLSIAHFDGTCDWGTHLVCQTPTAVSVATGLWAATALVYWCLYFYYIATSMLQLRRQLYQDFRLSNQILQLEVLSFEFRDGSFADGDKRAPIALGLSVCISQMVRRRASCHRMSAAPKLAGTAGDRADNHAALQLRLNIDLMLTVLVSFVALWFTGPDACASHTLTWVSVLPLFVAGTVVTSAIMFVNQPRVPSDGAARPNAVLQQFAWTQAGAVRELRARPRKLQGAVSGSVLREPLFCVEVAVKCFAWSKLMYNYDDVRTLCIPCAISHR